MEFIGEKGVSAPSLKEQVPDDPSGTYQKLLVYLKRLYRKADLVHGDLSEYNIMMWKGKLVLFDMSQSVPTSHPLAKSLLERDLTNLNRFFSRLDVKVVPIDEAFRQVKG
jgi:RIO kinase 1